MCVRSALSLPALILAGGLLFIVGAVVVIACRDRRPGFSYFAYGNNAQGSGFLRITSL